MEFPKVTSRGTLYSLLLRRTLYPV